MSLSQNGAHRAVDLDGGQRVVDRAAAERAAADFLAALGIDLDREERRATPARMAHAYAELLAAPKFFALARVPVPAAG